MKLKHSIDEHSHMLKYHIQTSGRSLHAQEIDFNDIRTALQTLYAIYDNCSSLYTNAYDEAITTPTKKSVRHAMAIQLIINKELGLVKKQKSVAKVFHYRRIDGSCGRGCVLDPMKTIYQCSKIQEESHVLRMTKHIGDLPSKLYNMQRLTNRIYSAS